MVWGFVQTLCKAKSTISLYLAVGPRLNRKDNSAGLMKSKFLTTGKGTKKQKKIDPIENLASGICKILREICDDISKHGRYQDATSPLTRADVVDWIMLLLAKGSSKTSEESKSREKNSDIKDELGSVYASSELSMEVC